MAIIRPVQFVALPNNVKRPEIQANPRFGHKHDGKGDCCEPKPSAATSKPPSESPGAKVKRWGAYLLTGVLGAGVAGNAVKTNSLENAMTENQTHVAERLAQKDSLIARQAGEIQDLFARLEQQSQRADQLAQRADSLNGSIKALSSELSSRVTMDQIMHVVDKVAPATVRVEGPRGLGSGVVIQDTNGKQYILTNSHVTEGNAFQREEGRETYRIKLYNGSDFEEPIEFEARIVTLPSGDKAASSPRQHDLALLEIPRGFGLPKGVNPVQLRDTSKDPIRVGEVVVAIGNPYGNRDNVTSGIVSHVDRFFSLEPENKFLATDAPINPGNSGGGLFDMQGRLVGINTLGYRGADGLGGSIRADVVKSVLDGWGIKVNLAGSNKGK